MYKSAWVQFSIPPEYCSREPAQTFIAEITFLLYRFMNVPFVFFINAFTINFVDVLILMEHALESLESKYPNRTVNSTVQLIFRPKCISTQSML